MENLTESQIKRKIDTLKRALEDKNVHEVAHPKMKEDLKKFEKMLKDFEKKVEKEAEKDIEKVDDIADLDLPDLDLDEDKQLTVSIHYYNLSLMLTYSNHHLKK